MPTKNELALRRPHAGDQDAVLRALRDPERQPAAAALAGVVVGHDLVQLGDLLAGVDAEQGVELRAGQVDGQPAGPLGPVDVPDALPGLLARDLAGLLALATGARVGADLLAPLAGQLGRLREPVVRGPVAVAERRQPLARPGADVLPVDGDAVGDAALDLGLEEAPARRGVHVVVARDLPERGDGRATVDPEQG